jgi:glycosyltransferase involved in cell wall biosynthesis
MAARNAGRFIGEAIESVLCQDGVEFELVVIDDGSEDETGAVAASFRDPRIRLFRNDRSQGIGRSHNRVLAESQAPFVAHVDSDDIVLPGAFRRMLAAFENAPRVGQAHCHYLVIDEDGTVLGDSSRSVRPGTDYRRELPVRGGIANHLRTYRRAALDAVGPFDERGRTSFDSEMSLRIADRYDIALVPEILYCLRLHGRNTCQSMRFKELRLWYQRVGNCRRLARSGQARYLREQEPGLERLLAAGLRHALAAVTWRLASGAPERLYRAVTDALAHLPVNLPHPGEVKRLPAGRVLRVDRLPGAPLEAKAGWGALLARRPVAFGRAIMFAFTHRHEPRKSFRRDRVLLSRAVQLARTLEARDLRHVHAVEGEGRGSVALLAASLLDLTCSLEVEPAALPWPPDLPELTDRLRRAAFVVTDSRHNAARLRALVGEGCATPILAVYPPVVAPAWSRRPGAPSRPADILCWWPLGNPGGLTDLLHACDRLRQRGLPFRCRILGEPAREHVRPRLAVRALHRRLGLGGCVEFGVPGGGRLNEAYSGADIMVSLAADSQPHGLDPSVRDLLEAMAAGLAVVADDAGAAPELIEHGVSGLLRPPGDPDILATALGSLIDDSGLRLVLGANATRRVMTRASSDADHEGLAAVLDDARFARAEAAAWPAS